MQIPEGAVWIGSDHPFDLAECYLNFRIDLHLANLPQRAVFTLTADSRYRLWVNGAYVTRGPSRCWPWAQSMDTPDITGRLCAGMNQIAVQVYCPGYSHFAYVHRGAMGFLGWIEVDGAVEVVSDQSWRVQRDTSWNPRVPRLSIYGAGVEQRDMTLESNWQTVPPESWATPRIVAPAESPIWSGLHLRDVEILDEPVVALTNPWQTRFGLTHLPTLNDPHQDLRRAFAACPAAPLPDRMSAGETAIWVFDLGHSQVCVAGADLRDAIGGESLTISYAEKLRAGEMQLSDPETYCRMRPTDVFHLRPGAQTVAPFSQRGGRYVIFRLDTVADCAPAIDFHIRTSRAPLAEITIPPQGDVVLDAVAGMCARTIRACLQDGFVDSIWRESSQWVGDVVAEAFALRAISNDARPLARAILMAEQGALSDGILPSVLPSETHAYVVTDYNFSWIELLEMYLQHPGAGKADAFVASRLPTASRMFDRFRQDLCEGLLQAEPGRRLFLDWSGQDRREPNLTYNLRYLHGLQTAARLANRLGQDDLAFAWADEAHQLQARIAAQFRQGPGWKDSAMAANACQLSLALLVLTNSVTGKAANALADQIIARSLDLDDGIPNQTPALASPFMHHYLFLALDHLGRTSAIRAIIHARWGRWAAAGEQTTWENWNVDFPDGSVCHGFSAHPLGWLKRTQTPKSQL